jgi:hypothetical protein
MNLMDMDFCTTQIRKVIRHRVPANFLTDAVFLRNLKVIIRKVDCTVSSIIIFPKSESSHFIKYFMPCSSNLCGSGRMVPANRQMLKLTMQNPTTLDLADDHVSLALATRAVIQPALEHQVKIL